MAVLVTAASRHDATREMAEELAEALRRRGVEADVIAARDVASVAPYGAVVLGSAVYFGHWLKEARALAEREAAALRGRPVWLFSVGPLGEPGSEAPPPESIDVADVLAATGAREHRVFSGRLDRSLLGVGERVVARGVHAPEGDFRDWDALDAYAEEIARALGTLGGWDAPRSAPSTPSRD